MGCSQGSLLVKDPATKIPKYTLCNTNFKKCYFVRLKFYTGSDRVICFWLKYELHDNRNSIQYS